MIDWAFIHEDKGFKVPYLPLSLMALIYGFGVRLRLKKIKCKEKISLPGFTVSIGSLTAGGTGKTPMTCMMAQWALDEGYDVAVLSRGYGGKNKAEITVVSDGKNVLAGSVEAGDEPYLLARSLPGVPVITAKDRYLAGLAAHDRFGSTFFILDDGYQHLKLKRDLNLLLLDAVKPFGNGRLLPRGPLREPVNELERADAIILTRANSLKSALGTDYDKAGFFKIKPVFRGYHLPEKIIFPFQNTNYVPSFLKGKRVMAFAGIARPDSFRDTLIKLGAEVLSFRPFPDHHPYSDDEIRDLIAAKEKTRADFLITTEKDWTRLGDLASVDHLIAYLKIKFDFLGEREGFFRLVRDRVMDSLQGQ